MYDECPSAGSTDCMDSASSAVGCAVTAIAGRVGSSFAARLSGPESVTGTVEYMGDGMFTAEYVGPTAGVYELEVRGRFKPVVFAGVGQTNSKQLLLWVRTGMRGKAISSIKHSNAFRGVSFFPSV